MVDYTTFLNRYYFKGILKFDSAAHIGSGYSGSEADSAFILDGDDKPMIPGSSIKGAMRSLVERMLPAVGKNTCVLFTTPEDSQCLSKNNKNMTQEDILKRLEENPSCMCDICWVFGAPFWAAKIKIKDAHLEEEEAKLATRYGVGIDRETGTAKKNVLFSFETTPPNISFKFEMIGENLTNTDLGVLSVALKMMAEDQFLIGAKTTSGLGTCKMETLEIKEINSGNFSEFLLGQEIGYKNRDESKQMIDNWVADYLNNEVDGEHNAESNS